MKHNLIVYIIIILGSLTACSKSTLSSGDKPLTYLALGDSYTIGESVAEDQRYPNQLTSLLKAKGMNFADSKIIARTGWTTFELRADMDRLDIYKERFDYVSLLIGVNNQYRGLDPEQYRKEFTLLLLDAIKMANGKSNKVFVVSIPDWGVTPFGKKSSKPNISESIDLFNKINKEETLKLNVTYIDITPGSRKATNDLSLIADDGLHPSGKMYKEWAEAIIKGFKF
jgi:lysophospholipase L1-like esterase